METAQLTAFRAMQRIYHAARITQSKSRRRERLNFLDFNPRRGWRKVATGDDSNPWVMLESVTNPLSG